MKQTTNIISLLADFNSIGQILESFLKQWWGPLIGALSGAAAILGLVVGVKYIWATQTGDEQKIKSAKIAVIGVFVGIIIVFLVTAIVPVIVAAFQSWYTNDAQNIAATFVNLI